MYLDQVFYQLLDRKACSEIEIAYLEKQLGIVLPEAYKEFLRLMGHSAGQFLQGSDCFFEQLFDLKDWSTQLLQENQFPLPLPKDAFIFFMHQGYQFSFFKLMEGNDPPIYFYCEGENQQNFRQTSDRFSQFLLAEWQLYQQHCLAIASLKTNSTVA